MATFLSRWYRVDSTGDQAAALDMIRREEAAYHLVVADVRPPGGEGFDFCSRAGSITPGLRFLLTSTVRIDDFFPQLRRSQILNVFVKTAPFLFDEFLTAVENLLFPHRAPGLKRYLREPMTLHHQTVLSRDDRDRVCDETLRFLRRYRQHDTEIAEIRLAFEEMVNNALYHGFRDRATGGEKYKAHTFKRLEGDEQVIVEYGCDTTYLGLSVSDNHGSLDAATVMGKLERQISMEGIFDENGRGLHLTRSLSDRMVINLRPGKLCQIVLLFARKPLNQFKPLHINAIPE